MRLLFLTEYYNDNSHEMILLCKTWINFAIGKFIVNLFIKRIIEHLKMPAMHYIVLHQA